MARLAEPSIRMLASRRKRDMCTPVLLESESLVFSKQRRRT
jgi:hypothetical protein